MPLSAADKLEIIELAARACHATDSLLPEEWADLFTEDGTVTVGKDLHIQGRAALLAHVRKKKAEGVRNRHFTSNPVVVGDGNQARMRIYIAAYDIAQGCGAPSVLGEYNYELLKIDGRWKARRRDTVIAAGRSRVSK